MLNNNARDRGTQNTRRRLDEGAKVQIQIRQCSDTTGSVVGAVLVVVADSAHGSHCSW